MWIIIIGIFMVQGIIIAKAESTISRLKRIISDCPSCQAKANEWGVK